MNTLLTTAQWEDEITDEQMKALDTVPNGILKSSEVVDEFVHFSVATVVGVFKGKVATSDKLSELVSNVKVGKAVNLSSLTNDATVTAKRTSGFHGDLVR